MTALNGGQTQIYVTQRESLGSGLYLAESLVGAKNKGMKAVCCNVVRTVCLLFFLRIVISSFLFPNQEMP